MPSREENSFIDVALGAGATTIGGGLLYRAADDPKYKRMMTDSMHNYLTGYYKGGAGLGTKVGLQAQEAVIGSMSGIKQSINSADSYAYQSTGISNRLQDKMKFNFNEIERVKNEFKAGRMSWKQANNSIKFLLKESHFKITNDYSNARLYDAQGSKPLKDYVTRKGSPTAKPYVRPSSLKEATSLLGKEELQYAKDIWGIGKDPGVKMQMYGRQSLQNPLRAINFDRRVYHAFQEMGGRIHATGKLTRNQVLGALQHQDLLYSQKQLYNMAAYKTKMQFNPLFRDLGKGKVAFNLSPAMKPNYDWGGFNGMVVWDKNKPTEVKLIATDKRDVAGVRQKVKMLNYTRPVTLDLNKYDMPVEKQIENLNELVEDGNTRKTRADKGKPRGPYNVTKKTVQAETIDNMADNKALKSVKEGQQKLLSTREAATLRGTNKTKAFQKYFMNRWLPTRTAVGAGIGLLALGTLSMYDYLHER